MQVRVLFWAQRLKLLELRRGGGIGRRATLRQDETILPCLAMGGAQGGIGGTTNYNGKELVGIIKAWEAGDIETARERQNFSQEVINVICHFRGFFPRLGDNRRLFGSEKYARHNVQVLSRQANNGIRPGLIHITGQLGNHIFHRKAF